LLSAIIEKANPSGLLAIKAEFDVINRLFSAYIVFDIRTEKIQAEEGSVSVISEMSPPDWHRNYWCSFGVNCILIIFRYG